MSGRAATPAGARRADVLIRPTAPIVPDRSIASRSLMAVVAIMTFLSALTAGGVQLIATAAADWSADVAREVTIQVRPTEGRDIEVDVSRAAGAARGLIGVSEAQAYSREDTERLLQPWLGEGLSLADLPIPRLVVLKIAPGATPDFAGLRRSLAAAVPNATLDDHRFWIERLSSMARTTVLAGLFVLGLMIAATALCVVFATHGAMAGNRDVVEVLHFVGAHDGFIAGEFQRHFLWLGLRGGLLGGGLAAAAFALAHVFAATVSTSASGDEMEALFGSFAMGWQGYAAIAIAVALVAAITGATSRITVHRVLRGSA